MARVQYSALVTSLKGSIGGSTFQENFSGAISRSRPNQRFFPSTLQSGARSDFATIATNWSLLDLSVQLDWNAFATANPIYDRWGNLRTLTGFQFFMQSNINLLSLGLVLLSAPPASGVQPVCPAYEVIGFSNSLHIDFFPALVDPDSDLVIYASAPTTSAKVTNRKNMLLIGHFSSPNASIFDITSMYATAYGLTWSSFFNSANCNIIFHCILVNRVSGIASTFRSFVFPIRSAPALAWSSLPGSWTSLGTMFSAVSLLSLFSDGKGLGLIGTTTNGRIFRSADYGSNWVDLGQQFSQGSIYSFAKTSNGRLFASTGDSGYLLTSVDNGSTWSIFAGVPSVQRIFKVVTFGTSGILISCFNPNQVSISLDNGSSWLTLLSSIISLFFLSAIYLEAGIVLIACANPAGIYRVYQDGSSGTSIVFTTTGTTVDSVVYCGNGICLASVYNSGEIFRSTDYGASWVNLGNLFGQVRFSNFTYVGNGVVLAGSTSGGLVIKSSDYGATWQNLGQVGSLTVNRAVVYLGNNKFLAGGQPSGLAYISSF